jgi:predicted unusual protein kinase regulating ubiquinone biosynthesis (AarF/ABC1/UbiB family)
VLLDHGLYRQVGNDFRLAYSKLYRALVMQDRDDIAKYCTQLGIRDWQLFSSLVLMRAYDGTLLGVQTKTSIHAGKEFLARF